MYPISNSRNSSSSSSSSSSRGSSSSSSSSNSSSVVVVSQMISPIEVVIILAEKYFDRFNSLSLLYIIPPSTPIAMLAKYLQLVIENGSVKKRNLQVRDITLITMIVMYCNRYC
jgi:hypothetical protein